MPQGLSNSDRSSALCSWAPVAGLLRPRSFSTPSDPTAAPACTRIAVGFRGSRPFRLPCAPARAFAPGDPSGSRLSGPTFRRLAPLPVWSTFRSLHCFRPVGLSRLSPPDVYLQGSRRPFESPRLVRPTLTESGLGDMLRTKGAFGPVFLHPPLRLQAGRPSGRRVSSHGKFRLLPRNRSCQTTFLTSYGALFKLRITSARQVSESAEFVSPDALRKFATKRIGPKKGSIEGVARPQKRMPPVNVTTARPPRFASRITLR